MKSVAVNFLLPFAGFVFLRSGCHAEYQRDYEMRNMTTDTVYAYHTTIYETVDTAVIPPGEIKVVYSYAFRGWLKDGIKDEWEDSTGFYQTPDDFHVIGFDSLESNIDYRMRNNWFFMKQSKTHAVYRTLIRPQDF